MPEDNQDDEDQEETFAYSDYTGVVVMIQTYYYKTLEIFRQYYLLTLKGRDYKPLKQQVQSYLITVIQLMRNYKPIQENKKLKKIFEDINKFSVERENISFNKLKECIDRMVDAHYILGLSKLEFKKYRKVDAFQDYKKKYVT